MLIFARDNTGVPCPTPIDATKVYTSFEGASYDKLAEKLLEAVTTHCSEDALSRLCGIAADGPYQASRFSEHLRDRLNITENEDLAFPITWDPAGALNLAVIWMLEMPGTKVASFLSTLERDAMCLIMSLQTEKGLLSWKLSTLMQEDQ